MSKEQRPARMLSRVGVVIRTRESWDQPPKSGVFVLFLVLSILLIVSDKPPPKIKGKIGFLEDLFCPVPIALYNKGERGLA